MIENDTWLASWLTTCTDAEQAELEAVAIERVAKFVETFPPLRRHWRPVTESKLRAELAGGMLIVEGKVDLTIGRTIGLVAGKVFVDFKTGGLSATHRDDLRLYALLETLRLGVPPRCVASVYLDQGRVDPEEVTLGVLQAAARRLIVGVRKLVELEQAQTPPQLQPGPACRWCIVAPGCATGQAFLTGQRLEDDP